MIKASPRETIRMMMTAMGITAINFPMMPEINNRGEKATTVVLTAITTGPPTSFKPSTTAAAGDLPRL